MITYFSEKNKIEFKGIESKLKDNIGIITIISALATAMIVASSTFGKGLQKFGIGIAFMSASILLLIQCAKKAAELSDRAFKNGSKAIAGAFAMFAGLQVLSKFTEKANPIKFSLSLIVMTGAMALLLKLAEKAGKIDPTQLQQGMLAIGALGLMIMALEAVSSLTGKANTKALTSLMVGLVVLFGEMIVLTLIPYTELLSAAVSMGTIMVAYGLMLSLASKNKYNVSSIVSMIASAAVVAELGYILTKLADIEWQKLLSATLSISATMLALSVVLKSVAKSSGILKPEKAVNLIAATIPILSLGVALKELAECNWVILAASTVTLSACMVAYSGVFQVISKFTGLFRPSQAYSIVVLTFP